MKSNVQSEAIHLASWIVVSIRPPPLFCREHPRPAKSFCSVGANSATLPIGKFEQLLTNTAEAFLFLQGSKLHR